MPKHLLTGEEFSSQQISAILDQALSLKKERTTRRFRQDLAGLQLALLFDKPSLRTRFSFTVAMRELGGDVIESTQDSRKSETPEDQIKVLAGYCDAVMVRTHGETTLERMKNVATIPVINGLSNKHHPCQILADLLTLLETFGTLSGLTVSYIGDGNNILHSLLLLAPQLGVNINYCCPTTRQPNEMILQHAQYIAATHNKGKITSFVLPKDAVTNTHAVYTDVWTSMGFENDQADEEIFADFQVNEQLMQHARSDAIFMHCLPMERGKEVSNTLPDQPNSVIFNQSENRLHAQKALLLYLLRGK